MKPRYKHSRPVHRSSLRYLDYILDHVHLLKRIPILGLRGVRVHGAFRMFNPSLDRYMNLHLIVVDGNVTSSTKVSSVFGKQNINNYQVNELDMNLHSFTRPIASRLLIHSNCWDIFQDPPMLGLGQLIVYF